MNTYKDFKKDIGSLNLPIKSEQWNDFFVRTKSFKVLKDKQRTFFVKNKKNVEKFINESKRKNISHVAERLARCGIDFKSHPDIALLLANKCLNSQAKNLKEIFNKSGCNFNKDLRQVLAVKIGKSTFLRESRDLRRRHYLTIKKPIRIRRSHKKWLPPSNS